MRLAFVLCVITSSAVADSSSLALSLPNPPMNYQSDSFSTGSLRCSNAVGGGVNLEYGVEGFEVGERVGYATGPMGAYSEKRVIPAKYLVKIPNGIDL